MKAFAKWIVGRSYDPVTYFFYPCISYLDGEVAIVTSHIYIYIYIYIYIIVSIMSHVSQTTNIQVPRPVFLDDDNQKIDDHPLHCSICCDVSFNPVITPCQHVFCRECIESSLRSSFTCPNDRRALNQNSLQAISGLHEYIYNRTLVQCPRCDKWTGQLQQYKVHIPTCNSSSYVQGLERKVQELNIQHAREMAHLQTSNHTLRVTLEQERHVVELNTAELNRHHTAEKKRSQNQITILNTTISELEARIFSMGPTFDYNYRYDESNMSDLSRIIIWYLDDKPSQIDLNRIFNCIKKCYDGAQYYKTTDMLRTAKILLLTAITSSWFLFLPYEFTTLVEWCENITEI